MSEISVFQADGSSARLEADTLYGLLEAARGGTVLPFAPERLDLVAAVGSRVLKSKTGYSPALKHFAFFTRPAALRKLAGDFAARLPHRTQARARGLVFHLPPQNVETVFLYSWVLSYLCGNANIVRLPRDVSADMRDICGFFLEAIEACGDASQIFAHYPSSALDINTDISRLSDARVVWGGDAKIAAFAPLPLRGGGKAIWFGDRFSFCLLSAENLADLSPSEQQNLAQALYNDIFVFDQMACSSPQVLCIVGDVGQHSASVGALLENLSTVARSRKDPSASGHQIAKMVQAFSSAAMGSATRVDWRNEMLTSLISSGPTLDNRKIGGGYLSVLFLATLAEVPRLICDNHQTITHFGFSSEEIDAVVASHIGFGASRWAPVGTALDFDAIWDGYDLPFEFTRLVRVQ